MRFFTTLNKAAMALLAILALFLATEASAFCTIAGNCKPVPEGTLVVTYIGVDKTETAEFAVYPAGKPDDYRNVVLRGTTGKPVALLAGSYDVTISAAHPLWEKNVVIKKDQTTSLEMGGFGELFVSGHNNFKKFV